MVSSLSPQCIEECPGWLYRRSPTAIRVRESHVEKLNKLVDVEYEILNVLEFNRSVWLHGYQ